MISEEKGDRTTLFCELLIKWWEDHKYDFPWRSERDPYRILVAELMLRKTSAKQVARVYPVFAERYPTPQALHEADHRELIQLLRPLGIEYSRARLMKRLAEVLAERYGGRIPTERCELLKLPGVGDYTANAVMCFSFGEDLPAVDANFIRLVSRVFGVRSTKSRARCDPELWEFAGRLVPRGRGREFNYAVLDFARDVCTAGSPKCAVCPLTEMCWQFKNSAGQPHDSR